MSNNNSDKNYNPSNKSKGNNRSRKKERKYCNSSRSVSHCQWKERKKNKIKHENPSRSSSYCSRYSHTKHDKSSYRKRNSRGRGDLPSYSTNILRDKMDERSGTYSYNHQSSPYNNDGSSCYSESHAPFKKIKKKRKKKYLKPIQSCSYSSSNSYIKYGKPTGQNRSHSHSSRFRITSRRRGYLSSRDKMGGGHHTHLYNHQSSTYNNDARYGSNGSNSYCSRYCRRKHDKSSYRIRKRGRGHSSSYSPNNNNNDGGACYYGSSSYSSGNSCTKYGKPTGQSGCYSHSSGFRSRRRGRGHLPSYSRSVSRDKMDGGCGTDSYNHQTSPYKNDVAYGSNGGYDDSSYSRYDSSGYRGGIGYRLDGYGEYGGGGGGSYYGSSSKKTKKKRKNKHEKPSSSRRRQKQSRSYSYSLRSHSESREREDSASYSRSSWRDKIDGGYDNHQSRYINIISLTMLTIFINHINNILNISYFTLICCFYVASSVHYDGWVTGNSLLPWGSMGMAVAYNEKNDTIWLVGGYQLQQWRLLAFKNNNFIDYGDSYFSDQGGNIRGHGQYYYQLNDTLWMIGKSGSVLNNFNVETLEYQYNFASAVIPQNVGEEACLTSIDDAYLVVMGGIDADRNPLSTVQIFNLSDNIWISKF